MRKLGENEKEKKSLGEDRKTQKSYIKKWADQYIESLSSGKIYFHRGW